MGEVLRTAAEAREWRAARRSEGTTVALVPTMGALHEGHLSLIDAAREAADRVIVSVFVNPTQFAPTEDFAEYPRDLDRDVGLAEGRGADAVFAPGTAEMYPVEQTIWVDPGRLADRLCGLSRPGHFRGVLTVVAKLFAIVEPEVAVFGRKDFQQSVLIRRMVRELGLPVRIVVAPTVREADALALSSRNAYLSAGERAVALSLSRALGVARAQFADGEREVRALEGAVRRELEAAGAEVEYAEIVDPEKLERPAEAEARHVCAIAARVGATRLIDNASLGGPESLGGPASLGEEGDEG